MQISPYVNFNGQCEAAFKFYEQVLGGKITFKMTWAKCLALINCRLSRIN